MPENFARAVEMISQEDVQWLIENLDGQAREEFVDAIVQGSHLLLLEPKNPARMESLQLLFHSWLISTRLRKLPSWQRNMAAAGTEDHPHAEARPMTESDLSELLNL